MPRRFLLILFLALSVRAQVPEGATRQEVIDLIGWPASTSKGGTREILNYPDFTVVLEQGRMTSLQFKPGKHKPPESYLIHAPKTGSTLPGQKRVATPEEVLGPNADREDPRPTLSTTSSALVS